jgi:hypothetical protein
MKSVCESRAKIKVLVTQPLFNCLGKQLLTLQTEKEVELNLKKIVDLKDLIFKTLLE